MPCPMRLGPLPRMMHGRLVARRDLGLLVVGRVVVRRRAPRTRPRRCRRSCRPAGCPSACRTPRTTSSGMPRSSAELDVGEAVPLGPAQQVVVERGRVAHLGGDLVDQRDLVEEPRVDAGGLVDARRRSRRPRAPAARRASRPSCGALAGSAARRPELDAVESRRSPPGQLNGASRVSSERSAFCSASVKLRPIAIASPTHFIVRGQRRVGAGELLEREPRHLDHDVVERRLEGRRRLAGDVVGDLVEGVADGELGGDLRDREAGRLGRQRAESARPAGSSR